jgi:hypothetical protein
MVDQKKKELKPVNIWHFMAIIIGSKVGMWLQLT